MQNLLLLKLLGRDLRDNWPLWRSRSRRSVANWLNRLSADLIRVALLLLAVWMSYLIILYILQTLWEIFSCTPSGNVFATRVSPGIDAYFRSVIDLDFPVLALLSVAYTLLITFTVASAMKFIGVYRLAYRDRGLFNRFCWVSLCAFLVATLFPLLPSPASLGDNAALYFLPSACLVSGVFALADKSVPEFTVVFLLGDFIRERLRIVRIRDLPPEDAEY